MDFLLLAVALFILMLGGLGLSLLLLPKQPREAVELLALSFLLGSSVVSMALFVFGFLISGRGLRWMVATLCVSLGVAGLRRAWPFKLRDFLPTGLPGWLLLASNAIQVGVVAGFSFLRVLGWDGLLNFESKARLAFLNGGVLPLEFFSDPSRTWAHQSYPLLLPLTESWLYLWLERADQELVKILFPQFFAAALCLLYAANRRLGLSGWRLFVAPLLVFTVPLLLVGDGSASSGYADFPLAVFYLATATWLIEFWRRGDFAALRLAGALLAAACWLKQEGMVLWLCATALVVGKALFDRAARREWRRLTIAFLPGLLVIVGWRGFVRFVNPPGGDEFLPMSLGTLRANSWRLPSIAQAVLGELVNWRHWGVLWLIVAAATALSFFSAMRHGRRGPTLLALAVLLPVVLYAGIYIFSIWPQFIVHLESSFPRLLIHVSPVAALLVGTTHTPDHTSQSTAP